LKIVGSEIFTGCVPFLCPTDVVQALKINELIDYFVIKVF